jgi:hypothetical protein
MHTLVIALIIAGLQSAGVQSTPVPASTRAPNAPAAADTAKLGAYDLEITTDEGTIVGAMTIGRNAAGLTAALTVGAQTPAVKSVVREGDAYVLTAGGDDFTVTYKLTFVGDKVSGTFKMSNGMSGVVAGTRKG